MKLGLLIISALVPVTKRQSGRTDYRFTNYSFDFKTTDSDYKADIIVL